MTAIGFRKERYLFPPKPLICELDIPCWISHCLLDLSQTVQESDPVFYEFVPGPEQTLFRTHNGFSVIGENKVIRR